MAGCDSRRTRSVAVLVIALAAVLAIPATAGASGLSFNAPAEAQIFSDSSAVGPLDYSDSDPVDHAECRYDHTAYDECAPLTSNPLRLPNGSHSYSVRATDVSGNVTVNVVNFVVSDSAAPVISAVATGGSPVADQLQLELTTDDSNARLYGSLDDEGAQRIDDDAAVVYWTPAHVTNGSHTAYFRAIDGAGNASSASVVFTLSDTTAPDLTMISPTAGQTLPTGDLSLSFSSTDAHASFTCRIDSAAPMQCSQTTSYRVSNLADGAHAIVVIATDNAGNSATTTTSFSVANAPASGLTINEPANGQTYTAQPLLKLGLVNALAADSLRCSTNAGPFVYCADGDPIDDVTGNGSWTVQVRGVDINGDKVTATTSFTVNDMSPPQVVVTPPGAAITDVDNFTLPVTIEDLYADASASFNNHGSCAFDGGAPQSCEDLLLGFNTQLTPGAHALAITGTDWAGNSAIGSVAFLVADNSAPVVQILAPANSATIADDSISVDFSVNDAGAQARCKIDSGSPLDCAAGSEDGLQSWVPRDLTPGMHQLTVTATDRAGNNGSASVNINVTDSTGPSISFVSPAPGATLSDRVVAHFLGGERLFGLECRVDSAVYLAGDDCSHAPGDDFAGSYRPASISSGAHTLWVRATDNHGNATSISIAITVSDTTSPDVHVDGVDGGLNDLVIDGPHDVYFWSSDPAATFGCSVDGAISPAACGGGSSGWFQPPSLANGAHSIKVRATDPSGNFSEQTVAFTVNDTTAPELTVDVYNGMPTGASLTTHPVSRDAASLVCALDGAAFANCSGGVFTASFTTAGQHTLRFRATDAAGNIANKTFTIIANVPSGPPACSGCCANASCGSSDPPATPAPPVLPTASAAFAKFAPKLTKRAISLPVSVTLGLPAGINAATTCSGSAQISLSVGSKIVKSTSAPLKLVKSACKVTARLQLKPAAIAGKKYTVAINFNGNAAIGPLKATKRGKMGKPKQ